MSIQNELKKRVHLVEEALHSYLPDTFPIPSTLLKAMQYSLFAGGKRLRPILLIAANELLDGNIQECLALACGVEMIHTYSLIHDDLPGMDNDDLRRGKPTNHKVFGEGMAILAGDGLLSYAFEIMIQNALCYPMHIQYHLKAIAEIAKGAGIRGMIAGQCSDLECEGKDIDEQELLGIHRNKIGAMITSSLLAGLLLNQPTEQQIHSLQEFGNKIGLSFQIMDDVLDIIGEREKLGKPIGSDILQEKATFPKLYGIDSSIEKAKRFTDEAISHLESFGCRKQFLQDLALYLINRKY